jgi:flavoprotein
MNAVDSYVSSAVFQALKPALYVFIDHGQVGSVHLPGMVTIDCKVCKNCSTAVDNRNAKCPECGKVL